MYCPAGSVAPVPVLSGRYTIDVSQPCGPGTCSRCPFIHAFEIGIFSEMKSFLKPNFG